MQDNRLKALFVDDNPSVLAAFRRNLRKRFEVATAESAEAALRCLETEGPFAIIVSDLKMPGMDGVAFLERSVDLCPESVRIMLTGNAEKDTAMDAVNRSHVYRFLIKPCSMDQLSEALEDAARRYEALQAEHRLLEQTVGACVKALADVLGLVAPFALGRGQRLKDCLVPFLKVVNIKGVWQYEVAALLSSLGYTSLPHGVIGKLESGKPLEGREASIVRQTPEVGYELISAIPKLDRIAKMIKYQRKNYNGAGYPEDTVSGQSIPLGARLLRVFEDRMELEREGVAGAAAKEAMLKREGAYDPKILELCFKYYPDYLSSSIAKDRPVFTIELQSLKPGMVIVSDVSTTDGVLLVEAGNRLTSSTIKRIRNYALLGQASGPFFVQKNEES